MCCLRVANLPCGVEISEEEPKAILVFQDQEPIITPIGGEKDEQNDGRLSHVNTSLLYFYTMDETLPVSVLESWTSNLANRFRQIVINSTLPQERKKALLYLNSFKGWFLRTPPKEWITQEDMKLARKIFKHIYYQWRKPSFKHIAMHLLCLRYNL